MIIGLDLLSVFSNAILESLWGVWVVMFISGRDGVVVVVVEFSRTGRNEATFCFDYLLGMLACIATIAQSRGKI